MQMLNPRASKILNKLFSENDYTSVAELATLTKSSNRSVRYNLQKIDQFLMKHRLPLLQRHNHKGVRLEKNQKHYKYWQITLVKKAHITKFIPENRSSNLFYSIC